MTPRNNLLIFVIIVSEYISLVILPDNGLINNKDKAVLKIEFKLRFQWNILLLRNEEILHNFVRVKPFEKASYFRVCYVFKIKRSLSF